VYLQVNQSVIERRKDEDTYLLVNCVMFLCSTITILYVDIKTEQLLTAIDSIRYDCAGQPAQETEKVFDGYYDIDTTDYYMEVR